MSRVAKYYRGVLTIGGLIATHIEDVAGLKFFEDPKYGDEAGLWVVYKGRVAPCDYFTPPDEDEISDAGGAAEFFAVYAED